MATEPEPEEIRRSIDETRAALTEKLGALGEQITQSVESTRATVEGTIDTVRSTVEETVDTVKHTFDVRYQVDRHPWIMMGLAFGVGFGLQKLTTPRAVRAIRHRVGHAAEHAAEALSAGAAQAGRQVAHGVRTAGERLASTAGAGLATALSSGLGGPGGNGSAPSLTEPGFLQKALQGPISELDELKQLGVEAAKSFLTTLAVENLPRMVSHALGLLDHGRHRPAGPGQSPDHGGAGSGDQAPPVSQRTTY
jgi:hypothetical protein